MGDEMRNGGKVIKQVLTILLMILLLVGTVWPTGLNVLLPEKWHYETWPLALKVAGWLIVLIVFLWDAFGGGGRRGDDANARD